MRDPSHTYTFTANDNGRNASAALNSVTAGTYLYNGFEQRVQKAAGGTTTKFVYDRFGHLLEEANGSGAVQKEYIWLDDLPVAMVDDTGSSPVLYFIHTDQLGAPQKISDGSASVVWDAQFDPFGNVATIIGGSNWGAAQWGSFVWGGQPSLTNLRFPGQYFDSETALNQNEYRDYDPTIGRFIQSDPIGLSGGINTYAYVGNNPLILIDPTGLAGLPPGLVPPAGIPGGPWTSQVGPGQRSGHFYGPAQPKGPKATCEYVPPEGQGGPGGSTGYWEGRLPGQPLQRYDLNGNPITVNQAHQGRPSPGRPIQPEEGPMDQAPFNGTNIPIEDIPLDE